MCRNIKVLHNFEPPATDDEVHAAALQYVRKVAGTAKPSHANQAAFDDAVLPDGAALLAALAARRLATAATTTTAR